MSSKTYYINCKKRKKVTIIVIIRWPVKAKLKGTKSKIKIKKKVKGKDFRLNLCLIFLEITERNSHE
jgi:hypothetical protein